MTLVALVGSHIGFLMARRWTPATPPAAVALPYGATALVIVFASSGAILAGLYISSLSLPVWTAFYGENALGETAFKNLNSLISIMLGLMVLAIASDTRSGNAWRWRVWCLVVFLYVAGWCLLLRGARMDVINALITIFFTWLLVKKKRPVLKLSHLLAMLGAFVVFQTWGALRNSYFDRFELSSLVESVSFVKAGSDLLVEQGTVNDIAATFSGTLYFVEEGSLPISWGLGYLRFLPRTAPAILWPHRPGDEAEMFSELFGVSSGGGFFELAQAYSNLGWLGVLFIPGLLSYLIFRAEVQCERRGTLWDYFFLWGFLGVWLRGCWYQTFAFLRGFTTALLVFLLLKFILALAGSRRSACRPLSLSSPLRGLYTNRNV